ncbi:CRISPR-associated helicase Cas3 [Methanocaldococcus lauensis]|nr:CRISPR-associated helicase Cas3 [Methanocaldococcus lauensis]
MDIINFFKHVTNHEPYDYQIRSWEKINKIMEHGGSVVIEIPTAGGKTEAAIIPYLYQLVSNDWKVPRLIYVLPTRSLVEKQAERIRGYIKKILEIKGYPKDKAEECAKKMVQVEYGLEETHAFLGFVVLTTWDTFLYGLAAHRTVGDRFTFPCGAIAQSLIVFDEIQMYQDENLYMPRLIGLVVKRLVEANVPLVFMTATLPTDLKKILSIDEEPITVHPKDTKKPERGEVIVKFEKKLSDDDLRNEIKKAIDEGKKVLIIKNKVNSAIEVYEKVKHLGKSLLLHSRFTVEDRIKKEIEIDKADIIVATQVVEAGLDLPNVYLVITDLAPLDALIQRIGRCARRKGEKGKVIVVLPDFDEKINKNFKEKIILGFKDLSFENAHITLTKNKDYGRVIEITIETIEEKRGKSKIIPKKFYIGDLGTKTIKKLIEDNKILKKKDLYIIPYSAQPYDPLIMIKSFDEVKCVGEYLYDIFKAHEALDRVYKEYYENNIVPKDYYSAYIYFRELKLFSTPPEYELKARPELFAMLYPLKDTEEKAKNKEIIDFNPKNVIRVSYNWLKNCWNMFDKKFELIKEYNEKEKSWIYRIKETEKLQPYKIYIIDNKYYSKETGIVV